MRLWLKASFDNGTLVLRMGNPNTARDASLSTCENAFDGLASKMATSEINMRASMPLLETVIRAQRKSRQVKQSGSRSWRENIENK